MHASESLESPVGRAQSSDKHGSLVGRTSGRFETEVIHVHALSAAASFGRILIFSLLSLSASLMSADSKLGTYPGEKPLASAAFDWLRENTPRLSVCMA